MLKSLKKNQVIIYVIALMLVAAGYLNYTSDNKTIETYSNPETTYKENIADIGDATLVNSNEVEENQNLKDEEIQNDETVIDDKNKTEEAASVSKDEYFTKSKIDRENLYSQTIETYQNIINSSTVTEEQRNIATQEITKINNVKNAIMICENLLETKGFNKNIVFANGDSITVVVESKGELVTNQVAQIQNIISREMKVDIQNITIIEK